MNDLKEKFASLKKPMKIFLIAVAIMVCIGIFKSFVA